MVPPLMPVFWYEDNKVSGVGRGGGAPWGGASLNASILVHITVIIAIGAPLPPPNLKTANVIVCVGVPFPLGRYQTESQMSSTKHALLVF